MSDNKVINTSETVEHDHKIKFNNPELIVTMHNINNSSER
jgi:hypothetical protein